MYNEQSQFMQMQQGNLLLLLLLSAQLAALN